MNQITVAGHLGADPEVRFTSSGQKVTTLRVAAKPRKGAKDDTIWWSVSVWGEQFDKMMGYYKKGSAIIVVGEISSKPEIFTNKEGKPQVSMNITASNLYFSPFGKGGEGASNESGSPHEMAHAASDTTSFGQGKADMAFTDDEIPF